MFRLLLAMVLLVSARLTGEQVYYFSDRPVSFTSTLLVDIEQNFPSFDLDGKIEQKVRGEVTVVSEQPMTPLFVLPYDISFVLRDMHVDMVFNGDKSSHDIKNPGTSLFLAQVAEIVNKPIKLRLGEDRIIHDEAGLLKKALKENPALSSLSLNNFFNDLLEFPFALACEELTVGKSFQRVQLNEFGSQDLIFQIIAITPKTITAKVKGGIPSQKVDRLGLSFKGRCEGIVTWSRANPLI